MRLTFSLFILLTTQVWGQSCLLNPQYADSTYGVWPKPEENLPHGTGGEYYLTDIQIKVPEYADEIDPSLPHYEVDWLRLDSITGLPDGFYYSPNDPDATWNKNEQGCVVIYGTADTGTYQLVLHLTGNVWVIKPIVPYKASRNVDDYILVLDTATTSLDTTFVDTTAIDSSVIDTTTIVNGLTYQTIERIITYPNPLKDKLYVNTKALPADNYNFVLFNLNGQLIIEKSLYPNSENELNLSLIEKGLYFYHLIGDRHIFTGKLIAD